MSSAQAVGLSTPAPWVQQGRGLPAFPPGRPAHTRFAWCPGCRGRCGPPCASRWCGLRCGSAPAEPAHAKLVHHWVSILAGILPSHCGTTRAQNSKASLPRCIQAVARETPGESSRQLSVVESVRSFSVRSVSSIELYSKAYVSMRQMSCDWGNSCAELGLQRTCAWLLLATFIWLLVFTKKVAFTPAAESASSVRAVFVGSGASSNVSATVCTMNHQHYLELLAPARVCCEQGISFSLCRGEWRVWGELAHWILMLRLTGCTFTDILRTVSLREVYMKIRKGERI